MKRSEMLEKMLRVNDQFIGNVIDKDFFNKYLNAILTCCEENGMLPPFNTTEYYRTWRDGGTGYVWDKEEN